MLPHIPRFARLVFVAMILVVVPCLFFFYPDASSHAMRKLGMESGGIDSIHVRPKVPPNPIAPVEVEQVKESFDDSNEDEPVVDDEEESGEDKAAKADLAAHEKLADTKHTDTHADESIDHAHHTSAAASASALVDANLLGGGVIMPHLGNATAKAELGRATWRFLHLVTLRFPDKPTPDDRETLKSFFFLFSRLYPCGECAAHFQKMLKKYPPQTSSRKAASHWLCTLHNIVNERLGKPEFDCLTLDDVYDCGCGNTTTSASPSASNTAQITGR